jgi:hypothetical protein
VAAPRGVLVRIQFWALEQEASENGGFFNDCLVRFLLIVMLQPKAQQYGVLKKFSKKAANVRYSPAVVQTEFLQ